MIVSGAIVGWKIIGKKIDSGTIDGKLIVGGAIVGGVIDCIDGGASNQLQVDCGLCKKRTINQASCLR